ncbi:hypothetical protein EB093_08875, partial [bacterium]|nr:hypothetical protein [bacterium]
MDEINGNGSGDVDSKQAAMQAVADSMTDALGKDKTVVNIGDSRQLANKTDADGTAKDGKGMSDKESNNVVVNMDNTNLT